MDTELGGKTKIIKYELATSTSEINKLLNEGYEPYGEPSLTQGEIGFRQPMVLHEPYSVDDYLARLKPAMVISILINSGLEKSMEVDAMAKYKELFGE